MRGTFLVSTRVAVQDEDLMAKVPLIIKNRFEGTAVTVDSVSPARSLEDFEGEIRRFASHIITCESNRRHHPTYGYTKQSIRNDWQKLCGMVAAYAFMTTQAMNAMGITPNLVGFSDPKTQEMVGIAQAAVENLKHS